MSSLPCQRRKNLDTVALTLELLRRIPRRSLITASELQQQLSQAGFVRDLRTIQRQLESLTEQFEIERDDRSKPYGYRWKERAPSLAIPTLSAQDALLLSLAEQQLRQLLPTRLMSSMDGFFAEARAMLSSHASASKERDWLSKVRVVSETQPLLPPKISSQVFAEVSTALFEDCWLDLTYRNQLGKRTQSRVMPLGLAQQGVRLYLICRFQGYVDDRALALHRMEQAQSSGLRFERPRDFSLQNYADEARFGIGSGVRIRLKLQIKKNFGLQLLETPLSKDQEAIDLGDCFDITATVHDSRQLDWWLRSLGPEVLDVKKISLAL